MSQNSLWYFGNGYGLVFVDTDLPTVITDGSISRTVEGVSTLTNKSGELLAYTDGAKIWNRNHEIMENGEGINGDKSSTQSAVFVPVDGKNERYYLFTAHLSILVPSSFSYSILDFSFNNGLGKVNLESKNTRIVKDVTEKIFAIGNGCSIIWVIIHKINTNEFQSYPIIGDVIGEPVISNIGSAHPVEHKQGHMKLNEEQTKLAVVAGKGIIELFDFDNQTGILSNTIHLDALKVMGEDAFNYGLEFSENGEFLYISEGSTLSDTVIISQYDLKVNTQQDINLSKTTVAQWERFTDRAGIAPALQKGPDKRIYVGRDEYPYISYINQPNLKGLACEFIDEGIFLGSGSGFEGAGFHNEVPNFPEGIAIGNDVLGPDIIVCNDSVQILSVDSTSGNSSNGLTYLWNTGETTSSIEVESSGNYWLEAQNGDCILRDTISVEFDATNILDLGEDVVQCGTSPITVSSNLVGQNYEWNTGSTSESININSSGKYSLTVTTPSGCMISDTVEIRIVQSSVLELGDMILTCDTDPITLSPNITANNYTWSTGETTDQITVSTSGDYWLEVETIDGCLLRDTINVSFDGQVDFSLGDNINECTAASILLSSNIAAIDYMWSTGETTDQILVSNSGDYWLEATIGECILRDTIQVSFGDQNVLDIGDMILTCNTNPITLMSNINGETYSWSTGENTPIIEVTETGSFTLEVETIEGCIYLDTIDIVFDDLSIDLGPDQEICIGDSTILSAPSPEMLSSILWSDGSQESELVVRSTDNYWLAIERGMCFASDTIMIVSGICDLVPDTMMVDTTMIGIAVPKDECSIYIPNAISIFADDPRNIDFYVSSNCALSSIEISIYDRWGNLLAFSTDSVVDRSDVVYQSGVYVAKVVYRFDGEDEVEQVLQSLTVL